MRFLILAAVAGAVALPSAANAQYYGGRGYGYGQGYGYGYNNRVQRERRECARELRNARNRWEYQRELRECRREILFHQNNRLAGIAARPSTESPPFRSSS